MHLIHYSTTLGHGVLIIEVSVTQRFVIERFHCIMYNYHYLSFGTIFFQSSLFLRLQFTGYIKH